MDDVGNAEDGKDGKDVAVVAVVAVKSRQTGAAVAGNSGNEGPKSVGDFSMDGRQFWVRPARRRNAPLCFLILFHRVSVSCRTTVATSSSSTPRGFACPERRSSGPSPST